MAIDNLTWYNLNAVKSEFWEKNVPYYKVHFSPKIYS